MPRLTRVLAASAALASTATLLAACQKPTPEVTLLSGDTTVTVKPQTYCFDVTHCRVSNSGNVADIKARAGSQILVDVPRTVALKEWLVTSATRQSDGTFQSIQGAGVSSGTVKDTHTVKVTVPYPAGGNDYFLIIQQKSGDKASGTWVGRVTITQ